MGAQCSTAQNAVAVTGRSGRPRANISEVSSVSLRRSWNLTNNLTSEPPPRLGQSGRASAEILRHRSYTPDFGRGPEWPDLRPPTRTPPTLSRQLLELRTPRYTQLQPSPPNRRSKTPSASAPACSAKKAAGEELFQAS